MWVCIMWGGIEKSGQNALLALISFFGFAEILTQKCQIKIKN